MKAFKALFFSIIGVCLLFTGCHKDRITQLTKIKIHVNGFSVEQEDISGAKDAIVDYSGVNAVTLAFYNGNTEVSTMPLPTPPLAISTSRCLWAATRWWWWLTRL